MITAARESELMEAAVLLLDARRNQKPLADLPQRLQPASMEEVYFVQDRMALAFGNIGGWKIGAATPEATPSFAPMPLAWISAGGSELRGGMHRYRGIEAEIAFQMGSDLPPRATPYTMEEVVAAIATMHPAIEVLETAYLDPFAVPKLASAADMAIHGGFVYGGAVANWQSIDFATESVLVTVDGEVRAERTGSNSAGNLMRLLPWLANEGAYRTGGLKTGDWITTGSWIGYTLATAGSSVDTHFSHAGDVRLSFA